jgi:hypothetical protein
MKYYLAIIMFLIIMSGVIWLEYKTWQECLNDNSVLYCVRVLNK